VKISVLQFWRLFFVCLFYGECFVYKLEIYAKDLREMLRVAAQHIFAAQWGLSYLPLWGQVFMSAWNTRLSFIGRNHKWKKTHSFAGFLRGANRHLKNGNLRRSYPNLTSESLADWRSIFSSKSSEITAGWVIPFDSYFIIIFRGRTNW